MLEIEDLRFRYGRRTSELFDGISHSFAAGSVTAVTGPSGRGKSTLLYVLGLMLRPSGGSVSLGGSQLSGQTDAHRSMTRARTFGFVFQDSSLDPTRSILDSIVEPAIYAGVNRHEARERARSLLRELGLTARTDHRPGEISGGQAQRAAICRAVINDPTVVLADEPTGNLDQVNSEVVLDLLRQMANEGRTIVIATHDPFVLDYADHKLEI